MNRFQLVIQDRYTIANQTLAVWLKMLGTNFTFRPGQFADFTLVNPPMTDAQGNTRTFSFASSPEHHDCIMIASRLRNSAFKQNLLTLPLGSRLLVSQPLGSFTLHQNPARPAVFLVGGIGITPVRSIIEHAVLKKLPHHLYLFYVNQAPPDAAFLKDLETWSKEHPRFRLIPTITNSDDPSWPYARGRIDLDLLKKNLPDLQGPIYYIVGPPAMVAGTWQILTQEARLSADDIKTEEFTGY